MPGAIRPARRGRWGKAPGGSPREARRARRPRGPGPRPGPVVGRPPGHRAPAGAVGGSGLGPWARAPSSREKEPTTPGTHSGRSGPPRAGLGPAAGRPSARPGVGHLAPAARRENCLTAYSLCGHVTDALFAGGRGHCSCSGICAPAAPSRSPAGPGPPEGAGSGPESLFGCTGKEPGPGRSQWLLWEGNDGMAPEIDLGDRVPRGAPPPFKPARQSLG